MRRAMGGADHTEQCLGRMSRSRLAAACPGRLDRRRWAAAGGDEPYRTDRPILRLALDEYRIVPQDIVARPGADQDRRAQHRAA